MNENKITIRIQNILTCRRLLWDISISQLKAKYVNSLLGFFWAIINPFLMMLVVTFIFSVVFKSQVRNLAFFILAGIFPWMFFSNALSEATGSLVSQQVLLRQFNLPKELIPISSVLANFINFLLGWFIFYPIFVVLNPKILFFLPVLLVLLFLHLIFTCGLSLLFSVFNVFYRDVSHIMGILMIFWLWLTPVFYSIEMVPSEFRWILNLNPSSFFISLYRALIFNLSFPGWGVILGVIFSTLISVFLGLLVFWRLENRILKKL